MVRIAPRRAPYDEAVAAYFDGRATTCLRLLHGHDTIAASLLRARAFMRAGRNREAVAELDATTPPLDDHRHTAEHQFLHGTALARCGSFALAAQALVNADLYATSTCDRELITEAAYYRALTAFMSGDLTAVEDTASEALDDQAGSSHGRLLELLGLTAAIRGDVDRSVMMLLAAGDHLQTTVPRDAYVEANSLNNLAIPVAEIGAIAIADVVRKRATSLAWNDELRPIRFDVTHSIAWLDALGGDYLSAFRGFRSAVELAPTMARRAVALTGRSYLAREMGEPINAAECIADAEDLAARIDWNATEDDERIALLTLATLVAPVDPKRAARHVERYKSIPKRINPMSAAAHGHPLYRAKEAHAFGLVAHAVDQRSFALPLLREAHQLFSSVGSTWRAGLVAMDLYDFTGDRAMLDFAGRQAMRVPHSWLARRVARVDS